MTVHNTEIADIFNRMAELLEIEDASPFRVRAYRRAAATLQDLGESAASLLARGGTSTTCRASARTWPARSPKSAEPDGSRRSRSSKPGPQQAWRC